MKAASQGAKLLFRVWLWHVEFSVKCVPLVMYLKCLLLPRVGLTKRIDCLFVVFLTWKTVIVNSLIEQNKKKFHLYLSSKPFMVSEQALTTLNSYCIRCKMFVVPCLMYIELNKKFTKIQKPRWTCLKLGELYS